MVAAMALSLLRFLPALSSPPSLPLQLQLLWHCCCF